MSKKDTHWFKCYYRQLLIATNGWSDEKFGSYWRLLIHQFDRDGLPDNENELKNLTTSFKKNWPELKKKFKKSEADGLLRNDFMKEISDERKEQRSKSQTFGKKGGRPLNNLTLSEKEPEPFQKKTHIDKNKILREEEERDQIGTQSDKNFLENSNLFRTPVVPAREKVLEVFFNNGGSAEMAETFFNKHQGVEWFLNGSPIKNFASLVPNFIANWKKNEDANNNRKNGQSNTHRAIITGTAEGAGTL